MVKRQSDSEESCAPDGRKWWNKPGYVFTTLIGVVGILILLGIQSVLGNVEKKADKLTVDAQIKSVHDRMDYMDDKLDLIIKLNGGVVPKKPQK